MSAADHVIADRRGAVHYPPFRSLLPAWLECICGVTVSALPDLRLQDPHDPLNVAWLAHRGARKEPRDHPVHTGWQAEYRTAVRVSGLSGATKAKKAKA